MDTLLSTQLFKLSPAKEVNPYTLKLTLEHHVVPALSCFHKAFPIYFAKSEILKKTALKPTWMTWSAYNGACQNFLGYIVLDIQHKTLPQILPCKFYVFEDFTTTDILLSYPTSSGLRIVQFTVPNKTPINFLAMTDTLTNSKAFTFSQNIEDIPQKPHNSSDHKENGL